MTDFPPSIVERAQTILDEQPRPRRYIDAAGATIGGGYRAILIDGTMPQRQSIFSTAGDVAAAALFCGAPVLSEHPDIRSACRARGVGLVPTKEHPL